MKFIGTKLKRFVTVFAEHFQMAQVTTSAAVLAYYTLLSIFPAVLVVGNLLPMLGLDAKTVLPYLQSAIPSSVYQFIRPIIRSEEHTSEPQSQLDISYAGFCLKKKVHPL